MPGKAYRWVEEMKQIESTFEEDGGWKGISMFGGASELYDLVAKVEGVGGHKGMALEEVIGGLAADLEKRKEKLE
jgi:hypothetical protein